MKPEQELDATAVSVKIPNQQPKSKPGLETEPELPSEPEPEPEPVPELEPEPEPELELEHEHEPQPQPQPDLQSADATQARPALDTPPASPAVSISGTPAGPTVDDWLRTSGLGEYADAIKDAGYHSMRFLRAASVEDLEELVSDVGMDEAHSARLLTGWAELMADGGGSAEMWLPPVVSAAARMVAQTEVRRQQTQAASRELSRQRSLAAEQAEQQSVGNTPQASEPPPRIDDDSLADPKETAVQLALTTLASIPTATDGEDLSDSAPNDVEGWVMVSCHWDSHATALRLANALNDRGYLLWIDTERPSMTDDGSGLQVSTNRLKRLKEVVAGADVCLYGAKNGLLF